MIDLRLPGALTLLAVVAAGTGCGEVSSPGSASAGGATRGGSSGASGVGAGGVGQGGSLGLPDAGGGAPADGGSEGGSSGSGGAAGGYSVPPGCPVPAPEPVAGQKLAIQSLKFTSESEDGDPAEIVVRNVSASNVTIIGGREGWQWCNVPAYWAITEEADVTLAPGDTYSFIPIYNLGGPRPLFRGDDDQDTNEMGIYPTTGSFDEVDKILAFVEWGKGSFSDSRQSIAVMANLWAFGELIAIGPTDAGFVATGPTNRGAGYTGVPARCLVAPPNK